MHNSAQADDDKAPNVEELFGSDDEDDDFNPSAEDVVDEQPAPSRADRLQALANKRRREQVCQLAWNNRTSLLLNRRPRLKQQHAASADAAATQRRCPTPKTCLARTMTRSRHHPSTRNSTARGRSPTLTGHSSTTQVHGFPLLFSKCIILQQHAGVDEEDVVVYGDEELLVHHEEAEEGDEFDRYACGIEIARVHHAWNKG